MTISDNIFSSHKCKDSLYKADYNFRVHLQYSGLLYSFLRISTDTSHRSTVAWYTMVSKRQIFQLRKVIWEERSQQVPAVITVFFHSYFKIFQDSPCLPILPKGQLVLVNSSSHWFILKRDNKWTTAGSINLLWYG